MKLHTIALLAAAGLSLAACGHKDEEAGPDANLTNITVPEDTAANFVVETPTPEPTVNTVEATPAPPVAVTPDEQTQDDADATGMTARVSRDEGEESGKPAQ
ncbi:hypothetical protein [Sphingomonas sp. dw_22]|uniref:hypothetical protein n=1 Tax=Sphingomonas sp. dw_22 TaxID=2721175 RepID=UPI001BD47925|nr:hypothetical protein [Sphingomonas sp. dw_22]